MSAYILNVEPIIFYESLNTKRIAPRKLELKKNNYDEEFDWNTLSYDVFQSGNELIFSGPPIAGFEDVFNKGSFFLNGYLVPNHLIKIQKLDRACRLSIDLDG